VYDKMHFKIFYGGLGQAQPTNLALNPRPEALEGRIGKCVLLYALCIVKTHPENPDTKRF